MSPLDADFNRAICAMAGQIFPHGFDVADQAPGTFRDLYQHTSLTGRMLVWSGASDRTIYADRRVNWTMRALHDSFHLAGWHDFTIPGETATCFDQIAAMQAIFPNMPESWRKVIWLDVVGLALEADRTGSFVSDQVSYVRERLSLPFASAVLTTPIPSTKSEESTNEAS